MLRGKKIFIIETGMELLLIHTQTPSLVEECQFFLRKILDIDIIDKHSSFDGRIIVLNLKINEKCFTFVNVYAPNDDKTKHAFFEKLKKYITQHAMYMENMYIFGDFNCNFEKVADRSQGKLRALLAHFDLIDVWQNKHNELKGYTWRDNNDIP